MFDLAPAAQEMKRLLAGVTDDRLGGPTPCEDWSVTDLLAHVHQFTTVFTQNARKDDVVPPDSLPGDWRSVLPSGLDRLVATWADEAAWSGTVSAGGVEMPAEDNAVVAVEELTVHAWDLAWATGQDFSADDATLDRVDRFFGLFGRAPYGPDVEAPEGASRLELTIARTGRDPGWRTSAP